MAIDTSAAQASRAWNWLHEGEGDLEVAKGFLLARGIDPMKAAEYMERCVRLFTYTHEHLDRYRAYLSATMHHQVTHNIVYRLLYMIM